MKNRTMGKNSGFQGICQIEISLNPGLICYDLESAVNSSCFSRARVAFPAPLEHKSITSKFAEDFCNCNSFWNSSIFADQNESCFCNYSNFMGFESQLQQFQWFTSLPSTWPAPTNLSLCNCSHCSKRCSTSGPTKTSDSMADFPAKTSPSKISSI